MTDNKTIHNKKILTQKEIEDIEKDFVSSPPWLLNLTIFFESIISFVRDPKLFSKVISGIEKFGKIMGNRLGFITSNHILYIKAVHPDPVVKEHIKNYYKNYQNNDPTDSGIDLLNPDDLKIPPTFEPTNDTNNKNTNSIDDKKTNVTDKEYFTAINFQIQCSIENNDGRVHGYYLQPRSSLTKTALVMNNSPGLIDFNYRGSVQARVKNLSKTEMKIEKNSKSFQLCSHDLAPITVIVVDELPETLRGSGGFGSTDQAKKKNVKKDDSPINKISKELIFGICFIVFSLIFLKKLF